MGILCFLPDQDENKYYKLHLLLISIVYLQLQLPESAGGRPGSSERPDLESTGKLKKKSSAAKKKYKSFI